MQPFQTPFQLFSNYFFAPTITPVTVPTKPVIAANISLFHDPRNVRCAQNAANFEVNARDMEANPHA
jgi:hypothetical protein